MANEALLGQDPRIQKRLWLKHIFRNDVELYNNYTRLWDEAVIVGSRVPNERAWINFRQRYQETVHGWIERRVLESITEGGQGSGNYGHSGRPGEVGGSGEAFYHGSSGSYAGLLSVSGSRPGADRYGRGIYLTSDPKEAKAYVASNMAGHLRKIRLSPDAKVLALNMGHPTLNRIELMPDKAKVGEFVKNLGYDAIRVIFPDKSSYIVVYNDMAIKSSKIIAKKKAYADRLSADKDWESVAEESQIEERLTEGGPGSGNYGHSGRPGEVGGSGKEFLHLPGEKQIQSHIVMRKGANKADEWDDAIHEVYEVYCQNTDVNRWLRRGAKMRQGSMLDKESAYTAKMLDFLVGAHVTDHRLQLFRGVDEETYFKLRRKAAFIDKGFVSTTHDRRRADEFGFDIVINILVPKGVNAFYVGHSPNKSRSEKEVILARGLAYKWTKDGKLKIVQLKSKKK